MSWTPILSEEQSAPYLQVIQQIFQTVEGQRHHKEFSSIDLMYGQGGIPLFLMYLSRCGMLQAEEGAGKLEQAIEKAYSQLTQTANGNLAFGLGVTGLAWMTQHLIRHEVLEATLTDLFEEVLPDLESFSHNSLENGKYDYLTGGSGYLLLPLEGCKEIDLWKTLDRLLHIAIDIGEDKIAWKYYDRTTDKVWDNFNLGLSHGNPALVMLLSLVYDQYPPLRPQIDPYIRKALHWISGTKNTDPDAGSLFSGYTTGIPNTDYTSLKWCYGDPGIGFCFYLSGLRLNEPAWQEAGISIIQHCVKRLDTELDMIEDAHLCHGTAGVGHMFNRMYQYTGMESFKTAALRCFKRTLQKITYEDGDLLFYTNKGDMGYKPFGGLMEGSAGIGLALLAAVSDIEPQWDRAFLLS